MREGLKEFFNLKSFGTRFFVEALVIGLIIYSALLGFYLYHFIEEDLQNKKKFLKIIKTELNLVCEDLTDQYLKKRLSSFELAEEASLELKKNFENELKRKTEDLLEHHQYSLMELPLRRGSDIPYSLREKFQCETFNFALEFGFTKKDLVYYFLKKFFPLLIIGVLLPTFGLIVLIKRYIKFKKPLKEIEQSLRTGALPKKVGFVELDMLIEAIESYIERERQLLEAKRLLEEEIAKQEKLSALGTMAGGLAHEFNNLLQMILANLELSKTYLQKNEKEEALKHLIQIERISKKGQELAARILFMSKPTPGESTQLCELLKDLEPLFRSLIPRDIKFILNVEMDGPLFVPLSEEASKEVLLNLIKNAVDAMEEKAQKEGKREISLRLKGLEKEVLLEVSDTGCGMTEDQLKRIFEPFYTTKGPKKGTGLGLYLVHNIIYSAGGRIEVESQPGKGTTFKIYLPIIETKQDVGEEKAKVSEEKREAPFFRKVLIVDDEEDIRETLKEYLELEGFEVKTAQDGKVAYEKLLSEKFDLLLVDMYMPEMDGLTLVKEAEKTLKELPYVVIMTGYAGELTEELKVLLERGIVKRVLRKPFSLADLEKILHNP